MSFLQQTSVTSKSLSNAWSAFICQIEPRNSGFLKPFPWNCSEYKLCQLQWFDESIQLEVPILQAFMQGNDRMLKLDHKSNLKCSSNKKLKQPKLIIVGMIPETWNIRLKPPRCFPIFGLATWFNVGLGKPRGGNHKWLLNDGRMAQCFWFVFKTMKLIWMHE